MFEINYKMAGNGYFMAELTPMVAAIAFMRTSMVCFEENNLQDALWYAGKAQRMALEDKREKVEQLVNAHFDAISLFQEAAHLWENREEIPKIVELLRQARLLCKNSRMRKPLAKKVSLLLDKAMKQGESRVIFNKTFSTELLDRFIQKTKEGAFEAVFLMCESEGILTNFASYMLLGSSALRAGEDKKAVDYLRRAATEATNEDRFDFLSHEQRAELCKIATLWLETARATLFIKERKFKSAYFILDAMGKNGLAQLGIREILKGFDENEEGSLLVCQIRDLRNKEKVAAAAAKALAYLEAA
jgi:hypothetical protein